MSAGQAFCWFAVGADFGAALIVGIDMWMRRQSRKSTEAGGKPASARR